MDGKRQQPFRPVAPNEVKYGHQITTLRDLFGSKDENADEIYWPQPDVPSAPQVYAALVRAAQPFSYEVKSRRGPVRIWAFCFEGPRKLLCTWAVEGYDNHWWIRAFANFPMDCGTPWLEEAEQRRREAQVLMDCVLSKIPVKTPEASIKK